MRYKEIIRGPGKWRRLQVRRSGECTFLVGDHKVAGTYDLGVVTTGRSRVYSGVFIEITAPDGGTYGADDPHSFVGALRALDKSLFIHGGWILDAVGLHPRFHQTGLTDGTEWGYYPGCSSAVVMLDPSPAETE